MAHDQAYVIAGFSGSGWISSGWHYYLAANEACLRVATTDSDSGSPPSGFSSSWFSTSYSGAATVANPLGDDEAQMLATYAGLIWWGPRNRWYHRFRDGIGKGPEMLCSPTPQTGTMLVHDPEDGSMQMVLLPGATS